jgi:hypothetical protein
VRRAKALLYVSPFLLGSGVFLALAKSAFDAGETWIGSILAVFAALVLGVAGLIVWSAGRPEYTGPVIRPGEVRRFRVRRQSTTLLYVAFIAGAGVTWFVVFTWGAVVGVGVAVMLVGAGLAWLFLGPPPGGRRTYVVSEPGLTIERPAKQRTIPWQDVATVRHFPFVAVPGDVGSVMRRYDDRVELELVGTGEVIPVAGAHRQAVLSAMVVSYTAPYVKRRLIDTFDSTGEVHICSFQVTRDGVHADGRLLRWDPVWTFERHLDPNGVVLGIGKAGDRYLVGTVPEPRVAIDVLQTLNGRI